MIQGMTALKGRGINDGGLAGARDGKQYYEYLVKTGPGLSYTVPELKEALKARIRKDYEALGRRSSGRLPLPVWKTPPFP